MYQPYPGGAQIEVDRLSERFGPVTAVDGLSFAVRPGRVTGFLGPNGAGKSTTMRLILGLDHPTAGTATIGGKPYRDLVEPLGVVGALLEAKAVHPGRSASNHLLVLAQTQGLPRTRVDEVIGLFALAIGGLVRQTAAAITGVIGFVLVLAPLAQLLPGSFGKHVHAYLPSEAGHLIAQAHQGPPRPAHALAGVRRLLPLDGGVARRGGVPPPAPRRLLCGSPGAGRGSRAWPAPQAQAAGHYDYGYGYGYG